MCIRLFLVNTATLLLFIGFSDRALAFDLKPSEIRGKSKSLPTSVLQNRFFTKTFRPELGIAAGTLINESYTDTTLVGLRGAIFVSEFFGVEGQYIDTTVKDSDDRLALNELRYRRTDSDEIVSPDPEINSINGIKDVNLIFAPFYGKLNLIDDFIIYSDLYMTGGVSSLDTTQGDLTAFTWGIGQRFYWGKNLSVRIDMRDRAFVEQRGGQDYTRHAYGVDFGVSYFFL